MKVGGTSRFQGDWKLWDKLVTLMRMSMWLLRGTFLRLFFKKSEGLVFVGPSAKILYKSHLSVGRNFIAERGCEINCLSKSGMIFGDKVTIGTYAVIRPSNTYGGDIGEGLKIGSNSNIGPYSYIGCSGKIEIGSQVMISPRVSIYAENHNFDNAEEPMKEQGVTRGYVKIEDDCWIASNSVILSGVTIGQGSVVAAGSIVTKDVPPFSVVAGNPARILKTRKTGDSSN